MFCAWDPRINHIGMRLAAYQQWAIKASWGRYQMCERFFIPQISQRACWERLQPLSLGLRKNYDDHN